MAKLHGFVLLTMILLLPVLVQADTPPVPQSKSEAIGDLDKRLDTYKAEKKKILEDAQSAQSDLDVTRKRLIDVAASIQSNETLLQTLDRQILDLESNQTEILSVLERERKSTSQLLLALTRIRRTPPEAMIAQPNAPIDTARSAMLFNNIIPALRAKTRSLNEKLMTLKGIQDELHGKRNKAIVTAKKLESEQDAIENLIRKREKLYADLNKDLELRQNSIARISEQAKTLSELVKKLDSDRAAAQKQRAKQAITSTKKAVTKTRTAGIPSSGNAQLPLSGVIRTNYNEVDGFGAKSKGLSIEGRSGALIVAPMGGVVRFAGFFKNYGNMVILEHKNGYHSLIAGLEKIDTVVEQSVSAGEPLGKLYNASNGKSPTLYFEFRHRGKAINPAKKFGILG